MSEIALGVLDGKIDHLASQVGELTAEVQRLHNQILEIREEQSLSKQNHVNTVAKEIRQLSKERLEKMGLTDLQID